LEIKDLKVWVEVNDYGYVKNKYIDADGRLAGAGLKTIFNSKYFTASLTYSWATKPLAADYFEYEGK